MKARGALEWALVAIAWITLVSGLAQAAAPGFVLTVVSGEVTPSTRHFFGIIGMFMALFGGLLLHALWSPAPKGVPVLWAGLQKFGAAAAVGLGVRSEIFGPVALLVAAFDLVSGLLVLGYWLSLRQR